MMLTRFCRQPFGRRCRPSSVLLPLFFFSSIVARLNHFRFRCGLRAALWIVALGIGPFCLSLAACEKGKKPTTPSARQPAGGKNGSAPSEAKVAHEDGSHRQGSVPRGEAPAHEGAEGKPQPGESPRPQDQSQGAAERPVRTEDQLKQLVQQGRYDESIREARRVLERNERSVPAMAVMAEAYFHKKEFELCRAVLASIYEQQKDHPLYLYLQGRMSLHEENYGLAQTYFEKAVEKNPQLLDAWTVIGVRRLQGGNYQHALEALLKARALPGGNTHAMNLNIGSAYRGLAHQKGSAEQLTTALNYYVEAEKLYRQVPGNAGKSYLKALYNKGILFLDATQFPGLTTIQRLERGIRYLESYVALAPREDSRGWAQEKAEVTKILNKAKNVDLPSAKAMAEAQAAQPAQPEAPREAPRPAEPTEPPPR